MSIKFLNQVGGGGAVREGGGNTRGAFANDVVKGDIHLKCMCKNTGIVVQFGEGCVMPFNEPI